MLYKSLVSVIIYLYICVCVCYIKSLMLINTAFTVYEQKYSKNITITISNDCFLFKFLAKM